MSKWDDENMEPLVVEALGDARLSNASGHHFGRPFVTSYQIAIEIERRHPGTAARLGKAIGGVGIGSHSSVAQYIGQQLANKIDAADGDYPVEGVFLSNIDVVSLSFDGPTGPITSSVTGTGYELGLYRLAE